MGEADDRPSGLPNAKDGKETNAIDNLTRPSDPEGRPEKVTRGSWLGLTAALAFRSTANPRLALDLVRLTWAFRARDWFRHSPFLPIPPTEYIRWRMYTAYGDETIVPPIRDVIRFARWRREVMHL